MSEDYPVKKIIDGKSSNKFNPNDDEEILKNKEAENKVADDKDEFKNGNKQRPATETNNIS